MKIKEIEAFDLYGDGTLVLKTNVDEPEDNLRYAWYVKLNNKIEHEVKYQKKSFAAVTLKQYGTYKVKAFVMNKDKEKVISEIEFTCNKNTSPNIRKFIITPVVSCVSGDFWKFSIKETFEDGTKYAWYIYRDGENEPYVKTDYSTETSIIHQFNNSGTYFIKVFVIKNGVKYSKRSEKFNVNI